MFAPNDMQCRYWIINHNTVLFEIDTGDYPDMANHAYVNVMMMKYMQAYPKVWKYTIEYDGVKLRILVFGNVNLNGVRNG